MLIKPNELKYAKNYMLILNIQYYQTDIILLKLVFEKLLLKKLQQKLLFVLYKKGKYEHQA